MKFFLFVFFSQLSIAHFKFSKSSYYSLTAYVLLISERSCSKPARDVQAQVLHSKENRFHWQALLLRYWSGGEVCVCVCLSALHPHISWLITYIDWKHIEFVEFNTGITDFTLDYYIIHL